ncbi:MAG: NDP-sugar synthase [Candidatus Cloacimonadota bacterium]|nr:MAG: NDP-sugar synthase [Candidatus Cloacimonadota bacterium]
MSELRMIEATILAAGKGTRLLPVTNFLPKPLLPIVTRPLLENIILSLEKQGIEKLCINVHHLKDKIVDFLQRRQYAMEIAVSIENRILGTGGGLGRMRRYIKGENFVVYNGDIVTDINIREAYRFHMGNKAVATLLIQRKKGSKDIQMEKDGRIINIAERLRPNRKGQEVFDFTGVAILNSKIFNFLPEDDFYNIVDAYVELIRMEKNIFGFVCGNNYWLDIGTKENYLLVHKDILLESKNILCNFSLSSSPFFVDKGSQVSKKAQLSGFVSIGRNSLIGDNVQLENCVIFDNTVIDDGKNYRNCIISKDFVV